MEKELQKTYLTYYNLLIEQELGKAHYQILSKIRLKKFIRLNVNTDMRMKNVKLVELHTKYATAFLNVEILKMT